MDDNEHFLESRLEKLSPKHSRRPREKEYLVSHERRKRHRKEKTKHRRREYESLHKTGRYNVEQVCTEDYVESSRYTSEREYEETVHRFKDKDLKDLMKHSISIGKHSYDGNDDDEENYYDSERSAKYKRVKYEETETNNYVLRCKRPDCDNEIIDTNNKEDTDSKQLLEIFSEDYETNEIIRDEVLITEGTTESGVIEEDVLKIQQQDDCDIKTFDSTAEDHVETNSITLNADLSVNNDVENQDLCKNDENGDEVMDSPDVDDLPPYYPAIQGCRSVNEFQILNHINEGTYGVVYRAKDRQTQEMVALKRLKMEKENEGFPVTSLREINTLLKGQHPNIVNVREIVMGNNLDKIFIVMDYIEHDLKSLIELMRYKKQSFTAAEVKCLLKQLLLAVAYLHDNWILHRDLKTSNLLLSHNGILKVGDFGMAREYGSPLRAYTPLVVTLWYRAPELLLNSGQYSTPIDMWSVGCIFGELVLMNPIFQGKSEVDQIFKIFRVLGTPNETTWPGFNKLPVVQRLKINKFPNSSLTTKFNMLTMRGLALLEHFLTYDPVKRITGEEALKHSYFTESPLPIDPSMFPTWPAKSELDYRQITRKDKVQENSTGFRINAPAMENRRLPSGGGFSLKF